MTDDLARTRPKARSLRPLAALLPFLRPYRGTLVVRGQVLSNAWWCYGSPPNCASDDGPGSPNATRPSASRTV